MTLIKRTNPFLPVSNFFDDIFADDFEMFKKMQTVPSVNIVERAEDYFIELAAPGFKKEDFEIDLDNNVLTISSSKEEKQIEENDKFTKREFSFNTFKRVFTLPDTADIDNIKAEYIDGILNVIISKKPEAQIQPKRKIDIK
ncbi:MAG: Hsp20/alpha crystallin family protein [Bacteroidales bacterium]|nr:Hsp20/alpha crystallin family protein [Bacteroidales bacterium]